jgi:hypothetical protein
MKMAFQDQTLSPDVCRKPRGIANTGFIIKDIFAIHVRLFFPDILGNDIYESEITRNYSIREKESFSSP